jgi:4-amino-4-deoxy-L-arabinose transferase-like glycosyltransferase
LHPSTLAKRGIVLLLFVVVAFYLYGLGHLPFVGPDEPRYAEVAREMFLRHDLITPTLGGQPWFEKPALLYWLIIAGYRIFGVSEFAARLPAALSGLLTIAAVACVERRVLGRTAGGSYSFWSTLAAATMLGVVIFSHAASFDILLTMTATWSLTFFILHETEDSVKPRLACLAGFYVFIGLSLLAKGLVGIVIPVGVVALYQCLRRRMPERRVLFSLVWGIPLACLIASVWYGPVIARHGWLFINQFFIQHHFARYLSNKYHHTQPVYYYLLIIPLLTLPWTGFLVAGLRQSLRSRGAEKTRAAADADNRESQLLLFALAWFLFPLLFFSFANSKLPGYILPVAPAAALMVGAMFRRQDQAETAGWPLKTTAFLCLVFAVGALGYAWRSGDISLARAFAIALPLFVAGVLGLVMRRHAVAAILLIACATTFDLILVLNLAAPGIAARESSKHLLQLAAARGYSQAPIYGSQRSDRTVEFYAGGRVVYGADGEPIMYEEPSAIIAESMRRQMVVLTFVPLADVAGLRSLAGARTEVIGDNGRYALVAIRAN